MNPADQLPARARVRGTVVRLDGHLRLVPSRGRGVPVGDGLHWVDLIGDSLPAEGVRVCARGRLGGRTLEVTSWAPEPEESSAWSTHQLRLHGADADVVDAMSTPVDDIEGELPREWPIISVGVGRTGPGRAIQTLEVDHLTPEIEEWAAAQPPGALRLVVFIEAD